MPYWEPQTIGDEPYYARIGPLHLWVVCTSSEWRIAVRRDGVSASDSAAEMPEDPSAWARFSFADASRRMRLLPVLPDRPLLVRPEHELAVTSNTSCRFYVGVPCWVRVLAGAGEGQALTEIPTVTLSNTWFGAPDNGTLCYAVKTSARRSLEEVPSCAHQVTCPVVLRNTRGEPWPFTRLCLRVAPLTVYAAGDRLWTNQVEVRPQGDSRADRIDVGSGAPSECTSPTEVSSPRAGRSPGLSWSRMRDLKAKINPL